MIKFIYFLIIITLFVLYNIYLDIVYYCIDEDTEKLIAKSVKEILENLPKKVETGNIILQDTKVNIPSNITINIDISGVLVGGFSVGSKLSVKAPPMVKLGIEIAGALSLGIIHTTLSVQSKLENSSASSNKNSSSANPSTSKNMSSTNTNSSVDSNLNSTNTNSSVNSNLNSSITESKFSAKYPLEETDNVFTIFDLIDILINNNLLFYCILYLLFTLLIMFIYFLISVNLINLDILNNYIPFNYKKFISNSNNIIFNFNWFMLVLCNVYLIYFYKIVMDNLYIYSNIYFKSNNGKNLLENSILKITTSSKFNVFNADNIMDYFLSNCNLFYVTLFLYIVL